MNPSTDFAAMLEQSLGVLQRLEASPGDCSAAAEQARKAVHAIDSENESSPQREAQVLAAIALTRPSRGKSIAETIKALEALDHESSARALTRKIAVAVAAALDGRARDSEQAEEARNKARSPFQSQTRRAQELAAAFATYPALATRVGELFVTDIDVRRRAKSAYSSVPRGPSRAVAYSEAFSPPRTIAKLEILQKTVLPRVHNGSRIDSYFPGRHNDIAFIEKQHIEFGPDIVIVGELAELSRGAPTVEAVDRAVAKADARLIAEFAAAIAKIDKLKALDASITEADISLRYPDGALIFAPTLFPQWAPRMMARWISLPDLGGYRVATE
jgi:hypothetical protein